MTSTAERKNEEHGLQKWARDVLELPANATKDQLPLLILNRLEQAEFMPPDSWREAIEALTGAQCSASPGFPSYFRHVEEQLLMDVLNFGERVHGSPVTRERDELGALDHRCLPFPHIRARLHDLLKGRTVDDSFTAGASQENSSFQSISTSTYGDDYDDSLPEASRSEAVVSSSFPIAMSPPVTLNFRARVLRWMFELSQLPVHLEVFRMDLVEWRNAEVRIQGETLEQPIRHRLRLALCRVGYSIRIAWRSVEIVLLMLFLIPAYLSILAAIVTVLLIPFAIVYLLLNL